MPPKRSVLDRSDEDTDKDDRKTKRQKVLPYRSKIERMIDDWLDLLQPATDEPLRKFNKREDKEDRDGVVPLNMRILKIDLEEMQKVKDVKTLDAKFKEMDSCLEQSQIQFEDYINDAAKDGEEVHKRAIKHLNGSIRAIQKARQRLPGIKPPPPEYATARNWADSQQLLNPMLCMRPVKCRGLPIFLLHGVFAQYLSLGKQPLPVTREARIALQVARTLCNTMGDYFDEESTRKTTLFRTIKPLFARWMAGNGIMSQETTETEGAILERGIPMVLTEIKNGKESGDAYMQASRRYEVHTEALREQDPDFLACGAPTFLCCLNGEFDSILNGKHITNITRADDELRIAGAFKVGEQVVVEPLSCDLLYPDSFPDGKIIQLAQHLFALYSCFKTLERVITMYGCPRVFSEVLNTETNQNEKLEFKKLLKEHWETSIGTIDYLNLLFDATLGGTKVFAKVVLRPYGKEVHARLASRQMAPQLYGTSDVHGIASVVVMQLLDDWITLFDYRENWRRDGIEEEPRTRLLKRV
ncbi:4756_t:CDS:2, partial [Acaulospora colombiana]